MSGGSWDYLCYKVDEASEKLKASKNPFRISLGLHLHEVAEVLQEIEWADSGDRSHDKIEGMILNLFEKTNKAEILNVIKNEIEALILKYEELKGNDK